MLPLMPTWLAITIFVLFYIAIFWGLPLFAIFPNFEGIKEYLKIVGIIHLVALALIGVSMILAWALVSLTP